MKLYSVEYIIDKTEFNKIHCKSENKRYNQQIFFINFDDTINAINNSIIRTASNCSSECVFVIDVDNINNEKFLIKRMNIIKSIFVYCGYKVSIKNSDECVKLIISWD